MADLATLAARIRELRRLQGVSQTELAGKDLSPSYISLLEAGKRTPTPQVLTLLARRLRCEPGYLLGCLEETRREDLEVELRFAELSLASGASEEALARFRAVRVQGGSQDLVDLRLAAEWGATRATEALGRLEQAATGYERLREEAHRSRGRVPWLGVVVALCRCYQRLGDLSRGIDVGEAALEQRQLLRIVPDPHSLDLVSALVALYLERGDPHRAAYLARAALEQASAVTDSRARSAAYWNASMVAYSQGQTADSLVLAEKALAQYTEGEDERALARLRLAYAETLLGGEQPRVGQAEQLLTAAASQFEVDGSPLERARCETELARAALLASRPEHAAELARRALQGLGTEHRVETARALVVLAAAEVATGDPVTATASYERAALALEGADACRQAATAWAELGQLLESLGDHRRAVRAYRRSVQRLGVRPATTAPPSVPDRAD